MLLWRQGDKEETFGMSSTTLTTLVEMVESLPEPEQVQVVEHLREYIEELRDERQWDQAFSRTQAQLAAVARRAKQEIREGRATPMSHERL
jgi:hypothetical protein